MHWNMIALLVTLIVTSVTAGEETQKGSPVQAFLKSADMDLRVSVTEDNRMQVSVGKSEKTISFEIPKEKGKITEIEICAWDSKRGAALAIEAYSADNGRRSYYWATLDLKDRDGKAIQPRLVAVAPFLSDKEENFKISSIYCPAGDIIGIILTQPVLPNLIEKTPIGYLYINRCPVTPGPTGAPPVLYELRALQTQR